MSDHAQEPDMFPEARQKKRLFSPIWLVPIIAALLAGYLGARSWTEHGPRVTLFLPTADGLSPGQTSVRYKGITLGTVESVSLDSDTGGVAAHIKMTAEAKPLLNDQTKFWLVKPRLNTSLSDIQSLVGGTYIQMRPGEADGEAQTVFTALENPSELEPDQPGTVYTLLSERLGPLGMGSAIYYRDVNVGEVISTSVGNGIEPIKIKIFVHAPYDKFVRPQSLFWNNSGVALTMGAGGMKLELQSLQSLLAGSLAFETPANALKTDQSASPSNLFPLYESRHAAEMATYTKHIAAVTYLHNDIKDLAVGSPVTIYGLAAGSVTDVHLTIDPQSNKPLVRVAFDIQPDLALNARTAASPDDSNKALLNLVHEGMRVRLASSDLVLGHQILSLEFVPQVAASEPATEGDALVLPSEDGGNLTDAIDMIAKKLEQIPFDEIGQHLNHLLTNADKAFGGSDMQQAVKSLEVTLNNARDISHTAKTNLTPALQRLPETSAQLQSAVTHANELMTSINNGFGQDSDFNRTVKRAMDEVNDASRSIRLLADFLERHPEALLQGKQPEPKPPAGDKP